MTLQETELSDAQSRVIAQAVREALARRRISRQMLADEARISISTLEKALSGRRPFTLATTIRLEEALGVSLRGPAPAESARQAEHQAPEELGAYSHDSVAWIEGHYLTLRPSFGQPGAIFAYRTEIAWDGEISRLVFREAERTDAPFAQTGFVSVPNMSGTIYLVTNWQGQHRIAMLCRPTIRNEMYGILTTLHSGRGSQLTPASCPIALIPEQVASAEAIDFGLIVPGSPSFAASRRLLGRVCEDAFAMFFSCPA